MATTHNATPATNFPRGVVATRADQPPLDVVGAWVRVVYIRNPGAAFSVGTGLTIVFSLVAVAVIVVIVRTAPRLASVGWARPTMATNARMRASSSAT